MATNEEIVKLGDLMNECYYATEIIDLYGKKCRLERLAELLRKYSSVDFGTDMGIPGILACEKDSTGYVYELISCLGNASDFVEDIYGTMSYYDQSLILGEIVEYLLSNEVEPVSALATVYKYLKDIGMESLVQNIKHKVRPDGQVELDIVTLICNINGNAKRSICNSIMRAGVVDGIGMVDILRKKVKLIHLGKKIGKKLALLGLDEKQIEPDVYNNILYLILNENTCEADISILDEINEKTSNTIMEYEIKYGTEIASIRPKDSKDKYELAYTSYGNEHKDKLDSLTGLELCRLCMIAKNTQYTAEEAFELAFDNSKYNTFIEALYNNHIQ